MSEAALGSMVARPGKRRSGSGCVRQGRLGSRGVKMKTGGGGYDRESVQYAFFWSNTTRTVRSMIRKSNQSDQFSR